MNLVYRALTLCLLSVVASCTDAVNIQEYDASASASRDSKIYEIPLEDIYLTNDTDDIIVFDGLPLDTSDAILETDIINTHDDPNNCGNIGFICTEHINPDNSYGNPSSVLCVAGRCTIESCIEGRADCNNKFEDGCETYSGSDPENCGYCGYKCQFPNSISDCQFSTCSILNCIKPFANCDKKISNGCETDTSVDINNCGMCNKTCTFYGANSECINSECRFMGCKEGFYDINQDIKDGCEYQCSKTNNGIEICDGKDNDCNGFIDETCSCTDGSKMPCGSNIGRCKEGYYECINGVWDRNCKDYIGPTVEECNNIDDDCNGETDDNLTRECQGADSYLCNSPCGTGYEYCQNGVWKRYNPPQPTKEICNEKDDNCNGLTDEGSADCPPDMVAVGLCLCIDRFEASRPDATDKTVGVNNSYATSRAGVLPWTNVDWTTADKACKAAGKRLCTAEEWKKACQGEGRYIYPYGDIYDPSACNGSDDPNPGIIFPTGSYIKCKSTYGVFDMSGNVEEWNATDYPDGKKGVRGGSYLNGTELFTKCTYEAPPVKADFLSRTIGFRCCKTP